MIVAKKFRSNIHVANLTALLRTGVLGALSAESYFFGAATASRFKETVAAYDRPYFLIAGGVLIFIYLVIYGSVRGVWTDCMKFLKSRRFDVAGIFVAGMLTSISFGGIGLTLYDKLLSWPSVSQLLILAGLPMVLSLLLVLRVLGSNRGDEEMPPFFISDVERKKKTDDLLGFAEEAERFAERVWNNGSSESVVFGIDAPWGIGKSTFVNFCKEYWGNNFREKIIVYSFGPLRYEDRANLLEKFVDGLVRAIQKNSFIPEIRTLISKYSRFIESVKASFTVFGIDFGVPGSYTIDDAFDDLESALAGLDKKIIIVIDDLDRLDFSAIKDVLSVVKKSFNLPSVSYVLCYDTDNINALEKERPDVEKVTEFLEKFVNVKASLYLDSESLARYVSSNLAQALVGNSQADPALVSTAIGGLLEIFKSDEFDRYLPFIGNVRKIKRFINTLLLLEIEKADFKNSDFDKQDLVHLLLIYINYPNIFRKIYNTETNGRRGFFSVASPLDAFYPNTPGKSSLDEKTYKNSTHFSGYIESLESDNQKFLLRKVFDVTTRLQGVGIDNIPAEARHTYACFNGGTFGGGANLEAYLKLIVKLSKPQKSGQYKFYANLKDEIRDGKKTVESVLATDDFSFNLPEKNREQLWRVLLNSLSEFDSATGGKLIEHLVQTMPKYSLFTNEEIGTGLRDDLDIFLTRMLDQVGWRDKAGKHTNNTEENIAEIAEWIFGEGRHAGRSILSALAKEDRGILGLHDLLCFRLFCSADRGGDIFNLTRALSKHGDPDAPTQGSTREIAIEEMREITQKVFSIFKTQYIDPAKNIFDIIEGLSLSDFAGNYRAYVESKIADGTIGGADVDASISRLKSRLKSFISFQLTNSLISHGVGCGYYDASGDADEGGIGKAMNDYLFKYCFNPAINVSNFEHFLDYLLINFASVFRTEDGRGFVAHINEFTKALDKSRLAAYWREHATAIKGLNLTAKEKVLLNPNYTASYKDDLSDVFRVLDELIQEPSEPPAPTQALD